MQTRSEQAKNFWHSFKIGFKGRLLVCIGLVLSVAVFDSISFPIIRLVASITILVTAELFVLCYVPFYIDNIKFVLKRNKIEVPLPDEIASLAKNMGLKISKMTVFPEVCNAYATGTKLFMGQKLLAKLDAEQIKAVAAHEFGHIKGRHNIAQFLYIFPLIIALGLSWNTLPAIMLYLGVIAYIMVALVPLHWLIEKKADKAAAKYVGKEAFKSALLAISEKDKINEASETHPAIKQRIKWIDELEFSEKKNSHPSYRLRLDQILKIGSRD